MHSTSDKWKSRARDDANQFCTVLRDFKHRQLLERFVKVSPHRFVGALIEAHPPFAKYRDVLITDAKSQFPYFPTRCWIDRVRIAQQSIVRSKK
jgi:hypothetical protein